MKIKPTFTGKITLKKLDEYIVFHRVNFYCYPKYWYFTKIQIYDLMKILNEQPYKGIGNGSVDSRLVSLIYKEVIIFLIH